MTRVECRHEADVLAAVSTNRWPGRVDAELRDHVATCDICTDVIAVVAAFDAETEAARGLARVPDSGIVWWKAQMRARQDAARAAARPITVAQSVAFAATVGVAGALFGATAAWFQHAVRWGVRWFGAAATSAVAFRLPDMPAWLVALVTDHTLLVAGGVVACLLAPVVVYLLVRLSERTA
jgi:hypothetical protein